MSLGSCRTSEITFNGNLSVFMMSYCMSSTFTKQIITIRAELGMLLMVENFSVFSQWEHAVVKFSMDKALLSKVLAMKL